MGSNGYARETAIRRLRGNYAVCIEQTAERRRALFENLAHHAGPARAQLCLNLIDAARLLGIDPSIIVGIEQGDDSDLSIEVAIALARGLGLTDLGLPRPKPFGSI